MKKYHYGGMCIRGAGAWDSGDVMLTNEGKNQQDGNHSRQNWVAMSGKVDGEVCGIAAMCHTSNLNYPQPVRLHPKMPYFCFAPMVVDTFHIKPGETFVSRYRFVSFDGAPDKKLLEEVWKDYTSKK